MLIQERAKNAAAAAALVPGHNAIHRQVLGSGSSSCIDRSNAAAGRPSLRLEPWRLQALRDESLIALFDFMSQAPTC